jgi:hypothetical protein
VIIPQFFSQVNVKFSGAAAPLGMECTFGLRNPSEVAPGTLATSIIAAWVARWLPVQTGLITLASVLVKNGPNDTGAQAEVASGQPGTAAVSGVPPNVALLVNKVTAVGGRKGRGRMFVPGILEANVDAGGIISGGSISTYITACVNFLTDLTTSGRTMVLLHADAATPPYDLVSLSPSTKVGTLKGRLR